MRRDPCDVFDIRRVGCMKRWIIVFTNQLKNFLNYRGGNDNCRKENWAYNMELKIPSKWFVKSKGKIIKKHSHT